MEDKTNVWKPCDCGKWTGAQWVPAHPSYCGIDPYLVWADLTRFAFYEFDAADPDRRVPLILELTGPANEFCRLVREKQWSWITIPSVYLEPSKRLSGTSYCTARVTREAFHNLGELGKFVKRFALELPISTDPDAADTTTADAAPADAGPAASAGPDASPPPGGKAAPRVIVGLIDDGLPVAHERVRGWGGDPASSRVRYCWNQDGPATRTAGSVADMDYGREISQQQIDAAIRDCTRAGLIDEDAVYRRLGLRNCRRHATHGAAMMDLACGEEPGQVPERAPDIICVELPRRTTADTSGASLAVHVLDALRYILDRADRLAAADATPPPQVVVNLSYGNFAGPHDGNSILECAIDELIRLRRESEPKAPLFLAVVLPAGNGHLSRCHGRHRLEAGASGEFAWHILPEDATPSFVEIWPSAKDAKLEVQVESPEGNASDWLSEGQVVSWIRGEDPLCTVIHLGGKSTRDEDPPRKMVLVCVAPTVAGAHCPIVAPSGVWKIRVRNAGEATIEVDTWIQRDDAVSGFRPRGRQSRFVDPAYQRFDANGRAVEVDNGSYIKRDGSLNAIATGKETVVVGGYRESDGAVAAYSASGDDNGDDHAAKGAPAVVGRRVRGPDALAVSERAPGLPGVLVAGSRSGGSTFALTGTSVAAPRVTRLIAEWMAAGSYRDRRDVAAEARREDPAPPSKSQQEAGDPPSKPPSKRGGGGRLKPRGKDDDHPSPPDKVGFQSSA